MIRIRIGSHVMKISGSTVLLTGATGGIGQAIARALAQRGASLVLTGRRSEVLEPLAAETGGRAIAVDLADREDLARLVEDVRDVDIVVANAALPAAGTLDSFTIEELDRALEVNLRAPIAMAHELIPGMVSRGRGHLVFISSLAGKAATPGTALYNASKFGLRGFAWALRADLRASGVGVSTVFPGFIRDAGMFHEAEVDLPKGVGTRTPDDVAKGVLTAIEKNRGEVDVAPPALRLSTTFAGIAPETAGKLARLLGSEDIARQMEAGQRDKR
jgi:short-subunit dehydrogenase